MNNLNIKQQLNLMVGISSAIIILLAAVYIVLLFLIRIDSNKSDLLHKAAIEASDASTWVQYTAHDTNAYSLGHLEHREEFSTHIAELDTTLARFAEFESILTTQEDVSFVGIAESRDVYAQTVDALFIASDVLFSATDAEREDAQILHDGAWEEQDVLGDELTAIFGGLEDSLEERAAIAAGELTQLILLANIIGFILPIIAVGFTALITFNVRNAISRPLTKLADATANIVAGNYNERVAIESKNEFGQLGYSFNHMTDTIQIRQTELEQLNQTLENRVARRTDELKGAHDKARASARVANENSRLKSEFLSMMSHELRTPMNAIDGFTGIMLNRMAGIEYNEKTERYLNKVRSNSRRLLGLINDFLDLSRIESGRLELAHSPMSPIKMAQTWEDNLSGLAENKGLELLVIVDPELPETIFGDEESLSKIMINLLGNAIKFTGEGSVTLKFEKRNEQMALEVRDTGIGIPPHAREIVFEEFRQVDQTSTRQYGGTGLGLSIVQKLVRAMNGEITLDSEMGAGSVFTVLLPIHTEEKQVA